MARNKSLHTDSQYTFDCATEYVRIWIENGWKSFKGYAPANKEDWKYYVEVQAEIDVNWVKIRTNQNKKADSLATAGIDRTRVFWVWGNYVKEEATSGTSTLTN